MAVVCVTEITLCGRYAYKPEGKRTGTADYGGRRGEVGGKTLGLHC